MITGGLRNAESSMEISLEGVDECFWLGVRRNRLLLAITRLT